MMSGKQRKEEGGNGREEGGGGKLPKSQHWKGEGEPTEGERRLGHFLLLSLSPAELGRVRGSHQFDSSWHQRRSSSSSSTCMPLLPPPPLFTTLTRRKTTSIHRKTREAETEAGLRSTTLDAQGLKVLAWPCPFVVLLAYLSAEEGNNIAKKETTTRLHHSHFIRIRKRETVYFS